MTGERHCYHAFFPLEPFWLYFHKCGICEDRRETPSVAQNEIQFRLTQTPCLSGEEKYPLVCALFATQKEADGARPTY